MSTIENAALIAVKDCVGVKKGEIVLIITDNKREKIGRALYEAAKSLDAMVIYTEIPLGKSHGTEPPEPVAQMMKYCQAILCPTTYSLTHTNARRNASKLGVRIATLPGITEDMMIRTLNADYNEIAKRSRKVADILTKGKLIHLTSPVGTDLFMPIQGITAFADTGIIHNPGECTNLPAGEAYLMPQEGKTNGVLYVDGTMAGGDLKEGYIKIVFKEGFAEEISGNYADRLLKAIEPFGRLARNAAEFGVGTNDKAILTGNTLEDEKILGTVHIALGDNVSMGGTVNVPSHIDGVVLNPTVTIDGEYLLKDGKLFI